MGKHREYCFLELFCTTGENLDEEEGYFFDEDGDILRALGQTPPKDSIGVYVVTADSLLMFDITEAGLEVILDNRDTNKRIMDKIKEQPKLEFEHPMENVLSKGKHLSMVFEYTWWRSSAYDEPAEYSSEIKFVGFFGEIMGNLKM